MKYITNDGKEFEGDTYPALVDALRGMGFLPENRRLAFMLNVARRAILQVGDGVTIRVGGENAEDCETFIKDLTTNGLIGPKIEL